MTDSNVPEELATKHDLNREQRIERIKRWVSYLESEPPEVWGPQQNAIVNGQLESAQASDISAAHRQRVASLAEEIIDERDEEDA